MASIAIRMTAMGVGFVQAILTARLLGPEGYGVVAVAMSVAAIAATLATLGLGPLAVREVAQLAARAEWGRLNGFLRFSLVTVLAASALAGAGLALGSGLFGPAFRPAVALAGLLVPLMALTALFRGTAQGFGRVAAAQAPGELLRPAVMLALLGLAALAGGGLGTTGYIALATGAALAGVLAGGIALRRVARLALAASPSGGARGWSRAGLPFLGITLAVIVQGEVNTLMLGRLAGPGEAGLFQPVARLAPLMALGVQAVGMRYAPRVSELWAQGDTASLRRITRLVTVTTTLAAVAACALILLAAPWLLAAFGRAFTVNAPALWWLAAAQVFNTACGPVGLLLTMTGHPARALRGHLAALAANAALGLWLIPGLGAYGAAQAMAGGIVVWSIVLLVSVRRIVGFDPSLSAVLRRGTNANPYDDSQ